MRATMSSITGGGAALFLAIALTGCGKLEQKEQRGADKGKERAEARRQRAACASSAAYDRLKGVVFDQAIRERGGDRTNLDTLADYSLVRMENPVVNGSDPALEITRCRGRLVLQIPPGAERAFAGERTLQADIDYTAQAAADGSGFVYRLTGGEPIVARLAAFNMTGVAYRPPPAIDEGQAEPEASAPVDVAQADVPVETARNNAPSPRPPVVARQRPVPPVRERTVETERVSNPVARKVVSPVPDSSGGEAGEDTVRAFYAALGDGNGATASARIVPEKRSSRTYSPEAMSRFYGGLPEPIRLTGITPLAGGKYRVRYRYSAGRSRCNGSAIVSVTNRGGRDYIRSIQALDGC